MNAEEQIKQLKEELYNTSIIYSWEYKGAGQKYANLAFWISSILTGVLFLLFLWLVVEELTIDSPVFWGTFAFLLMMVLVSRYLFLPDKHYCYHLTSMGIHYTQKDMIPEVAYKIVHGIAWVGIGVCIIAAFMLGPLAFVGAGAFALMSFGMIDFQPKVDNVYVLISDHTLVFHVSNDGVVSFKPKEKKGLEYVQTIYTSTPEQKSELLAHLKLLFTDIETVEVKRLNDQYKHPIYKQEEVVE
jgi:hypothetical protein